MSAWKMVSPSTRIRMSLCASAMPRLSAPGLPELGWLITRTYGMRRLRAMAAVLSVEPSSTTMTSIRPR